MEQISKKELSAGLAECRKKIREYLALDDEAKEMCQDGLVKYCDETLQAVLRLLGLALDGDNVQVSAAVATGLLAIRIEESLWADDCAVVFEDLNSAVTDALVLLTRFLEQNGFTVEAGDAVFFASLRQHGNLKEIRNKALNAGGTDGEEWPDGFYGELACILDIHRDKDGAAFARICEEDAKQMNHDAPAKGKRDVLFTGMIKKELWRYGSIRRPYGGYDLDFERHGDSISMMAAPLYAEGEGVGCVWNTEEFYGLSPNDLVALLDAIFAKAG